MEKPRPTCSYHTLPRLYLFFDTRKDDNSLSREQTHYLCNVMRLETGDFIRVFNEEKGEYLAKITGIRKNKAVIFLASKIQSVSLSISQHPILAVGTIKKKAMQLVVEKAVELGVSSIQPLILDNVHLSKVKEERLKKWAIEAVEQSEQFFVPEIEKPITLKIFLEKNKKRKILWACERSREKLHKTSPQPLDKVFKTLEKNPIFLLGPEGGFSDRECSLLEDLENVLPVDLGRSILRTETACFMMLSLYREKLIKAE